MIALITYILLVDYIYDVFAPLNSVPWAIFYFSNHCIAIGLIILKARKTSLKMWRPFYISVSCGFIAKGLLELTKIGMTIDEYNESVNNLWSHLLFSVVVILLITTQYYGRVREKRA